ncbi:MAG: hypothetical protein GX643_16890 [Acidimicrobiales bacterium]|nr:hypothetical protein [Acidimicrobiales bacterium]
MHKLAAFALLGAVLLGGCGDDGGDEAGSGAGGGTGQDVGAADQSGGDGQGGAGSAPDIAESIGGEDLAGALDSLGLEAKGEALLSATDADRFEIEGDVLHLYLSDGGGIPEGTECMIVGAVLSDGEKAVVHRGDETEVSCG